MIREVRSYKDSLNRTEESSFPRTILNCALTITTVFKFCHLFSSPELQQFPEALLHQTCLYEYRSFSANINFMTNC